MQALRLTKTGSQPPSLALETLPIPRPSPDQVLVKIRAASINPSDKYNAKGGFAHTSFPRVPGRDYAGVVVEAGGLSHLHLVGKHVYGTSGSLLGFEADGSHAEYCVVPVEGIAGMPGDLSFAQAASVGVVFTTAALVLERAAAAPGDVVLVVGAAGAVGAATCQLARRMGCTVVTAARREAADVNIASDPEMAGAKKVNGGKGPDVVIETTGSKELLTAGVRVLAERGRLAYIAAPKTGSTDITIDMKELYRMEKSIIGCNSGIETIEKTARTLEDLRVGFEKGELRASDDAELNLIKIGDAVDAYGTAGGKKTVIVFDEEK